MIEVVSENGRERIQKIEQLMKEMGGKIKDVLPHIYSKELIEVPFRLPYVKRDFIESAGLGSIKTSGAYLRSLEANGF
jgi:hypothetical protein